LCAATPERSGTGREEPDKVRIRALAAEARWSMESGTVSDSISTYLDEMLNVVKAISKEDARAVVERLFRGWREGSTTYIIGNGGSASTASHMMNDLNKMTIVEGAPRFRAVALTDNVPYITAVANDIEYADVFVEQLRNLLRPNDVRRSRSRAPGTPRMWFALRRMRAKPARASWPCVVRPAAVYAAAPIRS
jgi:hypothetical protein